jgi:hypothetical protein
MPQRKYFFVKHGLDSLLVLPNVIWRTEEKAEPLKFKHVRKGDRWIGFAYTTSDFRERPLSQITGFFECTQESTFKNLPRRAAELSGSTEAWMIEGKPYGAQPNGPVGVPPIDELLGRKTFKGQTFIPIDENDFERVRKYTLEHELDPRTIPILGREPRNEQEVLAVVIGCHKAVGIEKILRVRIRFPDLLVKLEGKADPVHLELESYSSGFLLHGHDGQVSDGRFKTDDDAENQPVGVLCWIDDEKNVKLKSCVHNVYELQQLLRGKDKIRW